MALVAACTRNILLARGSFYLLWSKKYSENAEKRSGYPLPWPYFATQVSSRDSELSRIAGLCLLKRLLVKNGHSFNLFDILQGAKQCVHDVGEVLSNSSMHSELENMFHPELYSAVREALQARPHPSTMSVYVESVNNLRLTAVNVIIGDAEPNDRHTISLLGQKIITSQKQMETIQSDMTNNRLTIHTAKGMGQEAFLKKLEVCFTVSFMTKEKIVIEEEGRVVSGLEKLRQAFHVWKFGSVFDWDNDYPLQWSIYDINYFLAKQV